MIVLVQNEMAIVRVGAFLIFLRILFSILTFIDIFSPERIEIHHMLRIPHLPMCAGAINGYI